MARTTKPAAGTPKAASPRGNKPAANGHTPDGSGIKGTEHRILAWLGAQGAPQRRAAIIEEVFRGTSINLKPHMETLVAAGLVTVKDRPVTDGGDKTEQVFALTAGGKSAAKKPAPQRAQGSTEHKALPKVGGTFSKEYKGKTITVQVVAEGFRWGKATYASLSTLAKAVRGSDTEVNGWAFFGLTRAKA